MTTRSIPTSYGRDDGYALLTAVLVSVVVLILSITAFSLSAHNQEASAYDRERVRAVHAAEAGINQALASLRVTGEKKLPCTLPGTLTDGLNAQYQAEISYFPAWPIDPATELACDLATGLSGVTPGAALVDSVGTAGPVQRRMETAVRLSPAFNSPFDKAVFSNTSPEVGNDIEIDGDVYTNEDWRCPNATVVNGNLYAQGLAEMANTCEVTNDLWTGGPVWLRNNARVGENAIVAGVDDATTTTWSKTPKVRGWSLFLENEVRVGAQVLAKGTCEGCVGPRVDPDLVATNQSSVSRPPREDFYQLRWTETVESAWEGEGFTIETYTDCLRARDAISGVTTKTVIRITGTPRCTLTFERDVNYNLGADLAIVTDGAIEFVNNGVWTGTTSPPPTLYLIVPYPADDTQPLARCENDPYGSITKENSTEFNNLYYFVYSPCTVTFDNHNDSNTEGQVYGGTVHLANFFRLTGRAAFVPGTGTGDLAGYRAEVAYIREIQT